MKKINISIVDDEELILNLLKEFFEEKENIEVLYVENNGKDFLQKIKTLEKKPDVVLLDLKMKEMNGIEITTLLHEKYPNIKIIIMSSYYKKSFMGYMLKSGVNAFIPKEVTPETLYEIIIKVCNDGYYFMPDQVNTMRNQISSKVPQPKFSSEETLSKREKEIISLICQQFTAQEIADKLFITKRTVEGHKTSIMQKTGVKNTAGLVIYAIQKRIVDIDNFKFIY